MKRATAQFITEKKLKDQLMKEIVDKAAANGYLVRLVLYPAPGDKAKERRENLASGD